MDILDNHTCAFASPCGAPVSVDKAWHAIRVAAGLPTLRIWAPAGRHARPVAAQRARGLQSVDNSGKDCAREVFGLTGRAEEQASAGAAGGV